MIYKELYSEFVRLFPDDIEQFQKLADSISTESSDGMHIMFGMVVNPFVMKLIADSETVKANVDFCFLKKMSESDDFKTSEVLEFTVLEYLISQGKDNLRKCKTFMGIKTLEKCLTIEKYMMRF